MPLSATESFRIKHVLVEAFGLSDEQASQGVDAVADVFSKDSKLEVNIRAQQTGWTRGGLTLPQTIAAIVGLVVLGVVLAYTALTLLEIVLILALYVFIVLNVKKFKRAVQDNWSDFKQWLDEKTSLKLDLAKVELPYVKAQTAVA